jgi:hypothetical protein
MTRSRSAARSAWLAPAAAGWARNTSRQPPGSEASRPRISSRSRRFTLLRTTAEPTARLTTKPTFAGSPERTPASVPEGSNSCPARTGPPARRPVRITCRNSSGRLIRDCRGSTTPPRGSAPTAPSGAQPRAALAASSGEDRPACPGAHPQPEAMDLRPPAVVRLERTLAHWGSRCTSGLLHIGQDATIHTPRSQVTPRSGPLSRGRCGRRVSLLTVRGITAQVKLSGQRGGIPWLPRPARPLPARFQDYHRGTPRFPQRVPAWRLRLWKIKVRQPVYAEPTGVAGGGNTVTRP